jgi:hypothetical protein
MKNIRVSGGTKSDPSQALVIRMLVFNDIGHNKDFPLYDKENPLVETSVEGVSNDKKPGIAAPGFYQRRSEKTIALFQ